MAARKPKKATRGKGEGSIYQRTDGLWCALIELPAGQDGKRRRKKVCRKDKAALLEEKQKLEEKLRKTGDLPTSSTTVEKWLLHWLLLEIEPHKRPKTAAGYRSVVENHIIPAIGKVKLDRVTPDHVRKVHAKVLSTAKLKKYQTMPREDWPDDVETLSSTYALNAHVVLRGALDIALREGKIHSNPCEHTTAPQKRVSNQKALTLEQAIHLLGFLSTHPQGAQWATYLLTGARRGEVIGLESDRVGAVLDLSWQLQRFSDISTAPKSFEHRHLGGTFYLTRPKSSAGWRIIPLVEPLKSILEMHKARVGEGLLFTNDDGSPQDPDGVTGAWKALLAKAKLPDDIVLHGSRHTTVDLLYEAGVPEALIQEIVGHSDRSVTRGYRSKGNIKALTAAMEQLSGLLSTGADKKELGQ